MLINKLKKSYVVLWIWELMGKPVPPPHIQKQRILVEYAKRFAIDTLVESGTYLGDMVWAMRKHFKDIYSIELSNFYYKAAKKRFQGDKKIHIIKGDSGIVIRDLLKKDIKGPALFWLDGHYSCGKTARGDKDTPVLKELRAIMASSDNHAILIDDARHFNGLGDYPSVRDLQKLVKSYKKNYQLSIEDDIIRITNTKR